MLEGLLIRSKDLLLIKAFLKETELYVRKAISIDQIIRKLKLDRQEIKRQYT